MAQTPNKQSAISIDEAADGGRPVVLRPENNDLFVRTGQQVIAACRLGISIEVWTQELEAMFAHVREWAAKREAVIDGCYAIPRTSAIVLFFVTKSAQFDFDLADQLVELNTHLLTSFNIGMIEVQQIPKTEADRFIDPKMARQVYGGNREPHHAVAS